MDVPETFRVGVPQGFGWFVSRLMEGPVDIEGLDGEWVEISGAPLPTDLLVRIDRAADGRFLVTGLLIGLRSRKEITWETLRAIKPSQIVGFIFSGLNSKNPAQHYRDTDPNPPVSVENPGEVDWEAWFDSDEDDPDLNERHERSPEHERARAALRFFEASLGTPEPAEPVTRARASVATDLSAFAEVYLRHLAATPHRATSATARELVISRATAIRRIAECRKLGLIPPKDQS